MVAGELGRMHLQVIYWEVGVLIGFVERPRAAAGEMLKGRKSGMGRTGQFLASGDLLQRLGICERTGHKGLRTIAPERRVHASCP